MKKAKPRRATIMQMGFTDRIYVSLHPNQKWEVGMMTDVVTLTNRFVSIVIPKCDYEDYFEEVEG